VACEAPDPSLWKLQSLSEAAPVMPSPRPATALTANRHQKPVLHTRSGGAGKSTWACTLSRFDIAYSIRRGRPASRCGKGAGKAESRNLAAKAVEFTQLSLILTFDGRHRYWWRTLAHKSGQLRTGRPAGASV